MNGSSHPQINWDKKVLPLEESQCRKSHFSRPDINRATQMQKFAWHPWSRTDYHLYLTCIEQRRDTRTRIEKVQLLETDRFRQVCLDDLFDSETFARVPGTSRMVTFVSLPVLPLSTQEQPTGQQLVLGFDLQKRRLLGYLFDSAPVHLADMGQVWERGELVIDIAIRRFLDIFQYTMEGHIEILDVGMFRFFRETTREFPLGLDMVITIQFAQFLDDFADLLWGEGANFWDTYKVYEEKLRDLLSRASRDAWFAARDGVTLDIFRQRKIQELVCCNLFPEIQHHTADAPIADQTVEQATHQEMSRRLVVMSNQLRSVHKQVLQIFFVLIYLFSLVA
ncbi:uncharacterized protein N7459_003666 [Penicillium hispanicum]|uniref:uncharacterized protein n=1 Tax=Penicillium hispanicum TaxID=1080232 RepID=UPI002540BC08|nr:uncharacterized protein N7459_003666 [Penicillium hispanicum]KAJ5587901.1 hypothetical protein N7459_003666 [Penicillium hispanicum]